MAAPTDGLWEDERTDEGQIGASYEELEWAMNYLENKPDTPLPETPISNRQKQVLSIYKSFNVANQHKMSAIPVCSIPKELL